MIDEILLFLAKKVGHAGGVSIYIYIQICTSSICFLAWLTFLAFPFFGVASSWPETS